MATSERDPHTGHMTTGHEWNGIKELNTAVPRLVWFFLIVTVIIAATLWVLFPTWPLVTTYTKGILGHNDREIVAERLQQAATARSTLDTRINTLAFDDIRRDPSLMQYVEERGHALFGDQCAVCHGIGGQGGPGYPNLAAASWLWGGDPEIIAETLRVGINSTHDETRIAEMMAFGRDGLLQRNDILAVTSYVQTLSDPALATKFTPDVLNSGRDVFARECVSCHGDDGRGLDEMGAPDLTDRHWIYGGDRQSIYTSIYYGRRGHMPQWEARLSETERRILTVYVLQLGQAEP